MPQPLTKQHPFRRFLCQEALFHFPRRHDPIKMVRNAARNMLFSFFEHARDQQKWANGTLEDKWR